MKKVLVLTAVALVSTALCSCERYPSTYPPVGSITGFPRGHALTARENGVKPVPDFVVEKTH